MARVMTPSSPALAVYVFCLLMTVSSAEWYIPYRNVATRRETAVERRVCTEVGSLTRDFEDNASGVRFPQAAQRRPGQRLFPR
jgi:hypothetical protein